MGTARTYDEVQWHYPDGKGCPGLDAAKIHFRVVTGWLKENGLLSPEGVESVDSGIDSDFALTTHMLTPRGIRILEKCYPQWLRTVHYGETPTTDLLDRCLKSEGP